MGAYRVPSPRPSPLEGRGPVTRHPEPLLPFGGEGWERGRTCNSEITLGQPDQHAVHVRHHVGVGEAHDGVALTFEDRVRTAS